MLCFARTECDRRCEADELLQLQQKKPYAWTFLLSTSWPSSTSTFVFAAIALAFVLCKVILLLTTVVVICVLYFCLLCLYISRVTRHGDEVLVAHHADIEPELGTGDIVLFRHKKYNLPAVGGVNRIVSHMGVLWQSPEGLCVVDMNPDPNGPYDVLPFEPILRGAKMLVYKFSDAVRTYPGELFVRRLRIGPSEESCRCFSTLLQTWALDLEYVETISGRSPITYLAFIFGIMTKPLAWLFASLSDLGEPRTASFCSEMIGQLLTRCNIADLRGVPLHFSGPINWLHDLGELQEQFKWGPEVQVVE